MRAKLEECSATIWEHWSKEVAKLQILRADVKNRKKSGDNFYKMDEESIITIQEELSKDFYVLAQIQIGGVQRLLKEFEDDQLSATLELEGYEGERSCKAAKQWSKGQNRSITVMKTNNWK